MLLMFLMPIFGRWRLGHRFNIAFTLLLLVGIGWLTAAAYIEDQRAKWTDPEKFAETEKQVREMGRSGKTVEQFFGGDRQKIAEFNRQRAAYDKYRKSKDYLTAVNRASEDAERVKQLAATGIPPSGALAMLRDDPQTQGRRLFVQHCASCHTHFDPDALDALVRHQDELEQATAPNLYRFASREWLKGLLNPKQINGPLYFGNTSHRKADMADFVTERLSDPKLWKPEEIEQVIAGLSAEADLPAQRAPRSRRASKDPARASAFERFRPLRGVSPFS